MSVTGRARSGQPAANDFSTIPGKYLLVGADSTALADWRIVVSPAVGSPSVVVVVHRAHGFRFVIYTLDHEPAHIHITGNGQAKIKLRGPDGEPEVVYSIGIRRSALRRLVAEVVERQDTFFREWERIHGRRH
jgi:hypothetical protein